jgi:sec-independent protein translocase protein TatA
MGLDNPLHIAFIVVILLLLFGARRLPEIGRSLGTGMREFKDSVTGHSQQAALPPPAAQAQAPAQPAQAAAQPVQVPAQPAQAATQPPSAAAAPAPTPETAQTDAGAAFGHGE